MLISIRAHLLYTTESPCDVLLQIEAATDATQICSDTRLILPPDVTHHQIEGEENVGTRRWVQSGLRFECRYETLAKVTRRTPPLETLSSVPVSQIPGDVTKFLMPSRYCHPEAFFEFVPSQFAGLTGGAQVVAMAAWITENFSYDNGASDVGTTATDSFAKRAGVCRDYAHVLISMVRGVGIPARFVSAYAPDVVPQDFHALVEVYLEGQWHLVDPTGFANPAEVVRIGVGRDAADASFMTSYGWMELIEQSVDVSRADKEALFPAIALRSP